MSDKYGHYSKAEFKSGAHHLEGETTVKLVENYVCFCCGKNPRCDCGGCDCCEQRDYVMTEITNMRVNRLIRFGRRSCMGCCGMCEYHKSFQGVMLKNFDSFHTWSIPKCCGCSGWCLLCCFCFPCVCCCIGTKMREYGVTLHSKNNGDFPMWIPKEGLAEMHDLWFKSLAAVTLAKPLFPEPTGAVISSAKDKEALRTAASELPWNQ